MTSWCSGFPWSQPHVWGLGNAAFLAPGIERHRNKSQKQQRSLNLWPQQQDLTWVWQAHEWFHIHAQNFFLPEDSRAPSTGDSCPGHARRERAALQLKACVLDTYGRSKGDLCLNIEWSLTKIPSVHGLAGGNTLSEYETQLCVRLMESHHFLRSDDFLSKYHYQVISGNGFMRTKIRKWGNKFYKNSL